MKGNSNVKEVEREILTKMIEEKTQLQRDDLIEFIKMYFKGETPKGITEFIVDDYLYVIADHLMQVFEKKINRLIINIPPGHAKTEMVSKCFPAWALGQNPHYQIITTGYSASLTIGFSQETKEIYNSPTYRKIFPRSPSISNKQNTKEHWINEDGGSYFATGTSGVLTGRRANCLIIDDPIKPEEAVKSDLKRNSINEWFDNTVVSRLFNPKDDAIIIIMQRTHENDLAGHIMEKMYEKTGEEYTVLSLPAICEEKEKFETRYGIIEREEGEALAPSRFSLGDLDLIRKSYGPVNFDCQYQQNPIAKGSQEFSEDWFDYYDSLPTTYGRTFTSVDPAFSKKKTADNSVITTAKFFGDKMYILKQTAGKYDPAELEDVMIEHIKEFKPEAIGVEAIAAQVTISFSLKRRLLKEQIHTTEIVEIRQKEDKHAKIRALIPLYRNGLIFHKRDMEELENEILKFPRGRRDDRVDGLQMLLHLYELTPGMKSNFKIPKVKYNKFGLPVLIT